MLTYFQVVYASFRDSQQMGFPQFPTNGFVWADKGTILVHESLRNVEVERSRETPEF